MVGGCGSAAGLLDFRWRGEVGSACRGLLNCSLHFCRTFGSCEPSFQNSLFNIDHMNCSWFRAARDKSAPEGLGLMLCGWEAAKAVWVCCKMERLNISAHAFLTLNPSPCGCCCCGAAGAKGRFETMTTKQHTSEAVSSCSAVQQLMIFQGHSTSSWLCCITEAVQNGLGSNCPFL